MKQLAIEMQGVAKRFGSHAAIDGVNLQVRAGEIFGFLGPNGAGKTTTIRCLMNFLRPNEGSIEVLGLDAGRDSVAIKRLVGYIPSDHHLVDRWSGRDHIHYVMRLRGESDLPQELIRQLSLDIDRPVKQLSSGNKQKLAIILGLIGSPQLLILDEPTQGLDPLFQNAVYELLMNFRASGGTVFVSSHNLPEVQRICDRVGIIREGKVVAEESLESLREKSQHIVRARFAKPLAKSALKLGGVELVRHHGAEVELKVLGSLNPALKLLSRHDVVDLEVTHASLEEIFMEMYS